MENWLNSVVSNRLKNFYRDNWQAQQRVSKFDTDLFVAEKRKSLKNPVNIDDIDPNLIIQEEFKADYNKFKKIVTYLDSEMFDILDSLLSGEKVQCYYKNKLINRIEEIMTEIGDE